MLLSGLINVAKPRYVTSRDVVDRVARAVGHKKVGHAGTLDPLASGVLVVCLGGATRLIEYVQQRPKRYRGTFLLGRSSPSDDLETEVTIRDDLPQPRRDQIDEALARFVGTILQRPPAFSAMKVDGRRAYKLARKGQIVELELRPIVIHRLVIERYEFPELALDIECGQGTYIRSLGRDLAERLGTVAVMSRLERTAIGGFTLADACPWDDLTLERVSPWILPPRRAVEHLPSITVDEEQLRLIGHGRPIVVDWDVTAEKVVALDSEGALVAILAPLNDRQLRVVRGFSTA